MSSMLALIASSAVLGLNIFGAAVPVKTVDFAEEGALCDESIEQYMQIEMYDYHDHPKVTMTWRQTTGQCGEAVTSPQSWTGVYDESSGDSGPDEDGKVKLEMFVCAPFGYYELDLVVESFSEEGSALEQRTAFQLENGPDEYHIWDTENNVHGLSYVEEYSPTVPGTYTWPLEGEAGYYKTFYAGQLPPTVCDDSIPAGIEYLGCFADSASSRIFGQGSYTLPNIGKDGMNAEMCSNFCSDYDFFGTEFAYECFCGTQSEFDVATSSDQCGVEYEYLCTGDATSPCGGKDAISIYKRIDGTTPVTLSPTPSSVSTPTPSPVPSASSPYESEGCFVDDKRDRIMSVSTSADSMSAEICYTICDNGVFTHFGTQFGKECWCGVNPDLTANGEGVDSLECSTACEGTTTGEMCGGFDRMSAYEITGSSGSASYIGCYADVQSNRAMPDAGKHTAPGEMTNQLCQAHCAALGYVYAGTQFGIECWCGDSFDLHGISTACNYLCEANSGDVCGGINALSVYEA